MTEAYAISDVIDGVKAIASKVKPRSLISSLNLEEHIKNQAILKKLHENDQYYLPQNVVPSP